MRNTRKYSNTSQSWFLAPWSYLQYLLEWLVCQILRDISCKKRTMTDERRTKMFIFLKRHGKRWWRTSLTFRQQSYFYELKLHEIVYCNVSEFLHRNLRTKHCLDSFIGEEENLSRTATFPSLIETANNNQSISMIWDLYATSVF